MATMTPNNLKERFPLAWGEFGKFVPWPEYFDYDVDYWIEFEEKNFEIKYQSATYTAYLDSVGVYVDISPILFKAKPYKGSKLLFGYTIDSFLLPESIAGTLSPNRPTATEKGIEKGMEIREEQLK